MKTLITILALVAVLASLTQAQQSPSSQPTQPQAQTAPCTSPSSPTTQGPTFKTPNKWKRILDQQRQQVQTIAGISVPDPTKTVEQTVNAKPAPCPPKAATPLPAAPAPPPAALIPTIPKPAAVSAQQATVKLPPGAIVTLRCNPTIPDSKGKIRPPNLLTDPDDFAVPKANEFEVDRVETDNSSSVSCSQIKIDPATAKQFLQQ